MPILKRLYNARPVKHRSKKENLDHKWVYNTKRWKDLRLIYLSENPLCAECLRNNHLRSAVEVHHIRHISQFKTKELKQYWGYHKGNLQSLCNECHMAEHKAKKKEAREQQLQEIKKLMEKSCI